MWRGSKLPRHCHPLEKRRRFPAEILLIEVREGCGPLELSRRRRGRIPLRTSLSQIPLKSFGFPGAESARKRFFLRGANPRSEKISARGRPTEIFEFAWSVAKRLACPLGKQPVRRAGRRPRLEVERVHTLSSSPGGCSGGDFGFRRSRLFFCGRCFRRHGRGALRSPTPPWGTGVREGCDPLALSQGCAFEGFVFDDAGCAFDGFCFRRRECGALRSPTSPRVTGGARGL